MKLIQRLKILAPEDFTIIERVLDEISLQQQIGLEKNYSNSEYIKKNIGELVKDTDLSKFIL